jgi:DNA-binding PadR family transcriptional regulator
MPRIRAPDKTTPGARLPSQPIRTVCSVKYSPGSEGASMAVRDALLGILLLGPAYGFQLHGELAARTGGRRTINVGQTYATLDRLAAASLIESAGTTDDGLPLHRLTEAGRAHAFAWLRGADASGSDPWDETADRVLVVASLPNPGLDLDLDAVLADERVRWVHRGDVARAVAEASARLEPAGPLAEHAAALDAARARAAVAWIDALAADPPTPFGLAATRPRRGRRPAVREASATVEDVQAAS